MQDLFRALANDGTWGHGVASRTSDNHKAEAPQYAAVGIFVVLH